MVRLVFRPYTQLRRSICTSESRRTSTRVSPGFILAEHRSPSFGSQRVRSRCTGPSCTEAQPNHRRPRSAPPMQSRADGSSFSHHKGDLRFHYALGVRQVSPETRAHVRLLGPCFKTGRDDSQHLLAADHRTPTAEDLTGSERTPRRPPHGISGREEILSDPPARPPPQRCHPFG